MGHKSHISSSRRFRGELLLQMALGQFPVLETVDDPSLSAEAVAALDALTKLAGPPRKTGG